MELTASKALAIRTKGVPVLLLGMPGDCRVYTLERERLVIGSELGCDLHLRLPGIASRHLMLQRQDRGSFEFFDLSGVEGLLLNGSRRAAGALAHGDELAIGAAHLVMIDPEADSMPPGLQLLALPIPLLREQAAREATAIAARRETFGDLLIENLRRSPWILISAAMHAAIWITLLAVLDASPEDRRGPPELSVDLFDAPEILDQDRIDESLDDLEPETEDPSLEEPVEIDESETPTPSLDEQVWDDDPGEVGEQATLGMSRSAMGEGGPGKGLGGPGGLGASAGQQAARRIGQLRQSGLDIVVLLDTTSSMQGAIRAAKEQIGTFIATLDGLGIEFRLGVVAFRDRGQDEDYLHIEQELTSRVYRAVRFIDRLDTGGGGNYPEAVYEALQEATSMRFSRRAEKLLVLVGDAPPHQETRDRLDSLLARFVDKGGRLHTIYVETEMGAAGRPAFRDMAARGDGSCVEIGSTRQLVREVLALTLATDRTDEIDDIIDELERGRTTDAIRRRLRQHDPAFVELMLRSSPMNPRLPLELGRCNHVAFLPAYLEVLRDDAVPPANRWLAAVMLRRALEDRGRTVGIDRGIIALADSLDPDENATSQSRLLKKLSQSLYDAGLLDLDLARPR